MKIDTFVSTDYLALQLGSDGIIIVDCRFNLFEPSWGRANYQEEHIPGAIFADLEKDLSGPITSQSGRHPLPDTKTFISKVTDWGIDQDKTVIVYDTDNGAIAARLWWLLKIYGYAHCAILSGGFNKWLSEGQPLETGVNSSKPTGMKITSPDQNMYCSTLEIEKILNDPSFLLIDARSEERFFGEQEPIDPIAGHIPGAINRFHGLNLNSDGTIKDKDKLIKEYNVLLEDIPSTNVIVYCGSGVTSCLHLAAMEYAGLYGARLYAGSWSEWIRNPQHPIICKNK